MSNPVVVQGTAVPNPASTATTAVPSGNATYNMEQNQQPASTGCNDPIFAILFYGNLAAILAVAALYGPSAFETTTGAGGGDYSGYIYAVLVTGVISFIFSGLGLAFLMQYPALMIKAGLIFVVVMSLVWCVMAFLSGSIFAGVIGLVFFLIGLCYARAVWSRIPFAAINMVVAGTAIKANLGVTIFAYLFTLLEVGWAVLWAIAFAGTYDATYTCDANACDVNYGFLFLLFVSFYFTQQVLQVRPKQIGC
jgi:hypothetical protein